MSEALVPDKAVVTGPVRSEGRGGFLRMLILCALSMSIGWGIRGNYGHEHGAMIAGALGTLAGVLLSGREDWFRRAPFFGLFGAIGWGFGGSISYMQVIGYTHSGHSLSVFYGFAMLWVIGFLWGAIGGAGAALPAVLSRERLAEFVVPGIALFAVLVIQDFAYDPLNAWLAGVLGRTFIANNPAYRHDEPLYWLDTDWTSFLLSIVVLGAVALVRRRWNPAVSFLMHLCVGWWVAFLVLPNLLGLRMTPPRGDSWAGCVGIVGGIWVYCLRNRLGGVLWASAVAGFAGGIGFSGACLFKLMAVRSGWETNWHSVLEQTYGAINGLGMAVVMHGLARRTPEVDGGRITEHREGRSFVPWPEILSLLCLLALIPWLNLRKNAKDWVESKAVPETLYWLPTAAWYNIGWIAFSVMLAVVLFGAYRRPISALPASRLGRAQWIYLIFLWMLAVGNFEKALTGFREQRLITEGVILLNAMVCTALALLWPGEGERREARVERREAEGAAGFERSTLRQTLARGMAVSALFIVMSWGLVRMVWGDTFAGHSGLHIRFGPNATTYEKPKAGKPHP